MAKRSTQDDRLRHLLTQECARIIAEEHIKDFAKAKRKAVERLGLGSGNRTRVLLPSNVEIEQALIAYQRLFKANEQPRQLRELRTSAVRAMRLLKAFRPHLVGIDFDAVLRFGVDELVEIVKGKSHFGFIQHMKQNDIMAAVAQLPERTKHRLLIHQKI